MTGIPETPNIGMAPAPDDIRLPEDLWSDEFAVRLAASDFEAAENYRSQNHDWRWRQHDDLYLGYQPQKYWEGTKVPRSSLSVRTAYLQIEALIPRIVSTLFSDPEWFFPEPRRQTSPDAAQVARDILLAEFDATGGEEVMRRAVKAALQYGNGIVGMEWLHQKVKSIKVVPRFVPKFREVASPVGPPQQVPSGEYERQVDERESQETINRPTLFNVPLVDFYIDPNCPGPDPREARYVIQRTMMPIDRLLAYRGQPGFKVPDPLTLSAMAIQKQSVDGDRTKGYIETARLASWSPEIEQTSDPAGWRVEILRYVTKDRMVWLLNRTVAVYNQPNPYGFINYYNVFYADVIDRFYAQGIIDVIESEQRLQSGITNARIDELALSIHPQRIRKRGTGGSNTYRMRMRPGAEIEADDPLKDVHFQYPQNITQQAFAEVSASEARAQKITGVTDFAVLGVPGGENPALRSATGAGTQAQASMSRVQYVIENIERLVLEPLLQDMHTLNQRFLDPNQMVEAVSGEDIDPIQVFGADVKFRMRASTRMQSRMGLMQTLPVLMQYVFSGPVIQQLALQGKTLDFENLFEMLMDATGASRRGSLVREMKPGEMQQMMAMKGPSPEQTKLQMQRERLNTMRDMRLDDFDLSTLQQLVLKSANAGSVSGGEGVQGGNPATEPVRSSRKIQ